MKLELNNSKIAKVQHTQNNPTIKQEQAVESSNIQDQFEIIKNIPKKNNVIVLTPPMRAISDPQNNNGIDFSIL